MSINDKLISDEEKHLTNTIDGIEYGVTNKGCIYYETPKGKQIIVCNFFMQLIRINDDLTDNKAYTFNVILQEGKGQKEVVLNNYNLKNSRWIDNLGMEYHLGKYAKYKDLKIYISNLIVEKMPETDMKIENVIDNIKKRKITTEKNLDLGKNFLLGLNRLLEADNNEYIASSRYNINMSDSNKVLGFKEIEEEKEVYYLKMDKVINRIKKFKDLFNEELIYKLNNPKAIYAQLAKLEVLIVNEEDNNKYLSTKVMSINYIYDDSEKINDIYRRNVRFFKLDVDVYRKLIQKYIEESEELPQKVCKNISKYEQTIYPILSDDQIQERLVELIRKEFNILVLDCESDCIKKIGIEKYKKAFNDVLEKANELKENMCDEALAMNSVSIRDKLIVESNNVISQIVSYENKNKVDKIIFEYIQKIDVNEIMEILEQRCKEENKDIDKKERTKIVKSVINAMLAALELNMQQEIAKKQKELIKLRKINNIDSSNDIDVDAVCKKFNI